MPCVSLQLMENLKKHQGDFMVACNNLVDDEGDLIFRRHL